MMTLRQKINSWFKEKGNAFRPGLGDVLVKDITPLTYNLDLSKLAFLSLLSLPGCLSTMLNSEQVNADVKAGYSVACSEYAAPKQGFYFGAKFYEKYRSSRYVQGKRIYGDKKVPFSEEFTANVHLSYGDTYTSAGHSFSIAGSYSEKMDSSIELIIGLLRFGALSDDFLYTPKVAISTSLGPVDAEMSVDFNIGRLSGVFFVGSVGIGL
jgi:hypothetical protein